MHVETINLTQQQLLNEKFDQLNLGISEYSFANIYLFQTIHHYQLFEHQELFIKGVTRDHFRYLMPTVPLSHLDPAFLKELLSHPEVDFLFPIPDLWKNQLDPQIFQASFSEGDSDYLFHIEKMRSYAGRNLSAKRNLVKQFLANNQPQAAALTADKKEDALSILENWQIYQELSENQTDYFSCQEALNLIEELELIGWVFYLDQKPCGFVLGEKRCQGSYYNLHFAKGDKTIKGLYQFMYQFLAQSLGQETLFINLEQDLNSPQVRQAKHSYQPDQMLTKWRIQLKKGR